MSLLLTFSTHLIHKSRQTEQIPISQRIPDSEVECSLLELLHLDPVHPAATVPQVQYGNIVPENGEEIHFYPKTYRHLLKLGRGGNHLFLES